MRQLWYDMYLSEDGLESGDRQEAWTGGLAGDGQGGTKEEDWS